MLKKTSFLTFLLLIGIVFTINAMPREKEHAECLKKATTDAEVTKCRITQIDAVKKEIIKEEKDISKEVLLKDLVSSPNDNLQKMRAYFNQYSQSHCLYYVIANSGNGYSDAFNKAKCELADILLYEGNMSSIFYTAQSDIKV